MAAAIINSYTICYGTERCTVGRRHTINLLEPRWSHWYPRRAEQCLRARWERVSLPSTAIRVILTPHPLQPKSRLDNSETGHLCPGMPCRDDDPNSLRPT